MDELAMWDDTMLIACTDHGFLLGEHDWWAKNRQPWYQELAHTPLFIWDPRSRVVGERRDSLVQMIDLPAPPFSFTKGRRTMKIPARAWPDAHGFGTLLFDVQADPSQENPLDDAELEAMMIGRMVRLMQENDSPPEQFERLGLQDYL